ncbi:MAG: hypothetical protein NVS4B2_16690 [Chloroflexota bacterium]
MCCAAPAAPEGEHSEAQNGQKYSANSATSPQNHVRLSARAPLPQPPAIDPDFLFSKQLQLQNLVAVKMLESQ